MKPLSQYPKHKRKKVNYIRHKNRYARLMNACAYTSTGKPEPNQFDVIAAAYRQVANMGVGIMVADLSNPDFPKEDVRIIPL